jgi:hypothetical protein
MTCPRRPIFIILPKTKEGFGMGTSTARRAPGTKAWRQAKAAATRYLSPDGQAAVTAQEVVARYMKALEDGAGQNTDGVKGAFRLARKIAQNLGEFCQQIKERGFQTGFYAAGFRNPAFRTPKEFAQGLATLWLDQAVSLEGAALRPALVRVLTELGEDCQRIAQGRAVSTSQTVKNFFAEAVYCRLLFDLGEPLEAVSSGWYPWVSGLAGIKKEIFRAVEAAAGDVPTPANWQGLEGWLWVTQVMERLMDYLIPSLDLNR